MVLFDKFKREALSRVSRNVVNKMLLKLFISSRKFAKVTTLVIVTTTMGAVVNLFATKSFDTHDLFGNTCTIKFCR